MDLVSEGPNSAGDIQQEALQDRQACILALSSLQHHSTRKVPVAAPVGDRLVLKSRS